MNTLARARLAGEIVWSYGQARWALGRRPLPGAVRQLRQGRRRARRPGEPGSAADGRHLARAVVRTLEALPLDSRCLMRSLVLLRVLARRGVPGELVIAARPPGATPAGGSAQLDAHAWVEVAGEPLLAPGDFGAGRLIAL